MSSITNDGRNYGIDLLRILAMMYIVTLHIIGHGGVLANVQGTGANFYILNFIDVFFHPTLDLFLLISGFVGYRGANTSANYKSVIQLFFQVLFYSFGIALIFYILKPGTLGVYELLKSLLPVSTRQYWFFTPYVVAAIAAPVINKFVNMLNEKEACTIAVVSLFFTSLYSTFAYYMSDPFQVNAAYSGVWFVQMYFIGALVRKYEIHKKFRPRTMMLIAIALLTVTYIAKIICGYMLSTPLSDVAQTGMDMLVSSSLPTIFAASFCMLCAYTNLKVGKKVAWAIGFFGQASFGVYLIHDNNYIRKLFITDRFISWAQLNPLVMVLNILLTMVAIYVVCTLIDKVRVALFKLLRINSLSGWLNGIAHKAIDAIVTKIMR